MEYDIWKRDEIESPCVKICVINEDNGLCIGCGRTRHEIAGWSRLEPNIRKDIMESLAERLENAKPQRKGGRSKRRSK